MEANSRKLASIMFTDIVGYSTLMQIDEVRASQMRARHKRVFQEAHKKYNGKIVQYFGDGTLSIFDSNVNSVECAVEMQIEFRKEPEVPLRIGIHSGDITLENDDAYGTGLNIAARIEPICEPGGVFISHRVYEDIKNHSWLEAVSLGAFRLKNIFELVNIYAISSKKMSLPDMNRLPLPPNSEDLIPDHREEVEVVIGKKNKMVAGFLALFMGVFGIHRFYLGKKFWGVVNFVTAIAALMITIEEGVPAIALFGILATIDAVLLFAMPREEFDIKYNGAPKRGAVKRARGFRARVQQRRKTRQSAPSSQPKKSNIMIRSGFKKYKTGNYVGAQKDFSKSLESDYDDPNVHFMLACCYSILKDREQAFFHLSSAVDFGFNEFEEVYKNEGLNYLRSLPEFESFIDNDYKMTAKLSAPEDGLLESKSYYDTTILDKISDLGELMERGVINREEFDVQKERLLGRN